MTNDELNQLQLKHYSSAIIKIKHVNVNFTQKNIYYKSVKSDSDFLEISLPQTLEV